MSDARSWLLSVDWLGRPGTVNGHRRLYHHARARIDREWRAAGAQAAMVAAVPKELPAITVQVWGQYPNKASLPDPDGVQPAAKAVIDGLRDRGCIVDDDGGHVRSICYLPPVVEKGCKPGLMVRVTEVPED